MTNVAVSYGELEPTHDISLSDGVTTYGLIFAGGSRVLQEIPLSPPADTFANEQNNWVGGRGRVKFEDDQTGYFDDFSLWSTTEQKLMNSLQWRFARIRSGYDTSLPVDNSSLAWWKLYGSDPTNKVARYLSIAFVASSSYNADKGYLNIRRRGTTGPGTLTFELCANNAGSPGSVLQTVTKTTTDITDTVNVFQVFDWTSTQALVSSTTYHIKIYGASSDSSSNYWEVLCNSAGTSSKYSTDNSAWTTSTVSMFYRITNADTNRQWFFFMYLGGLYAVSKNDDGTTSVLLTNGVRGTATSATASTLTDTNLAMTVNQYAGAWLRIFDGTADGEAVVIVSNTSDTFTISGFSIVPDNTSRYLVYNTDYWNVTTGTSGLGAVVNRPVQGNQVMYFPQGQAVNIRRMRVNATSHDFAADGTNKADILYTNTEQSTPQIYLANAASSTLAPANATVAWGVNLTPGTTAYIGGSDFRITNMVSYNKVLHVFKEDGLYNYNNGIVEKMGTALGDLPDRSNGVGVGNQGNYLWFNWAHSVERMIGSSVDDMLNFKRGYMGLPLDRRGTITSIVSGMGWLFFVIDGGTTNYSSILVYNGMGWHEIFRSWAIGVRIRNAFWQPALNTRPRLWFDVGGDMAYIEFPQATSNPSIASVNYTPEGVLITSTYDNHDQQLYKVIANLRVFIEQGSVEVDYQTNANVGTSTWTVLGTASTSPVTDLPVNLGGVFRIRFRFRMQVTATRTPTILNGWQITGRMMQNKKYQYVCTFQTSTDGETKTSENDHDANVLYAQLQTWAQQQTKLTMRSLSYSADNKAVTVSLPSKSVDNIDEDQWTGRVSLAILEI